MARKPSKTIVQPDQHELFVSQVRARFADIGGLGSVSLGLTLAFSVSFIVMLCSMDENFWFRPALMTVRWPLLGLAVFAVATEVLRSMRWIERKDMLATAYIATSFAFWR